VGGFNNEISAQVINLAHSQPSQDKLSLEIDKESPVPSPQNFLESSKSESVEQIVPNKKVASATP
jgi:hypothetical protein